MSPTTVAKAALYDRYRLPYAPAAVDDLLELRLLYDLGLGAHRLR